MKRTFLRRFIANPRQVGSFVPSGDALIRNMLHALPIESARTIVELGAGVGTFTQRIVERVSPGCEVLAIEIDAVFAATLRDRFPRVHVVEDTAERLPEVLRATGQGGADIVVSGLPFANFTWEFRQRVLAGVHAALRPGGHFVTYQYAHARAFSSHLEDSIREEFPQLEVRLTMANMPPAFVFHASV